MNLQNQISVRIAEQKWKMSKFINKEEIVNIGDPIIFENNIMKTLDEKEKFFAVTHLDRFTKLFCRDKTIIDELKFICDKCDFLNIDGVTCNIKVMAHKLCPDYKEFGSMGDL